MDEKPINVLLIEDNKADARLIEEMLRESQVISFQLTCEDSLSTGISRLLSEKFDVLLLDLGLPESKGLETLKRVISHSVSVPIVIITGLDDEAFANRLLQEENVAVVPGSAFGAGGAGAGDAHLGPGALAAAHGQHNGFGLHVNQPNPFAGSITGPERLTRTITAEHTARGDKFSVKNIQVSSLRGVQAATELPEPGVEAYILGEAVMYHFYAGQDDEVYRDIVNSLRDPHAETL